MYQSKNEAIVAAGHVVAQLPPGWLPNVWYGERDAAWYFTVEKGPISIREWYDGSEPRYMAWIAPPGCSVGSGGPWSTIETSATPVQAVVVALARLRDHSQCDPAVLQAATEAAAGVGT